MVYTVLTVVFMLACSVLRSLALIFDYDIAMGVYKLSPRIAPISDGAAVVMAVLLGSAVLFFCRAKRGEEYCLPLCSRGCALAATLAGTFSLAYSFSYLLDEIRSKSDLDGAVKINFLPLLLLAASVATLAYFICSAWTVKKKSALLSSLAFGPILWVAICLLGTYFDHSSPINDPQRLYLQMTLIAVMMFLLMELRFRVGKAHLGGYVASSAFAAFMGVSFASSSFVLYFQSGMANVGISLVLILTIFCISLYALARLATFKLEVCDCEKKDADLSDEAPESEEKKADGSDASDADPDTTPAV